LNRLQVGVDARLQLIALGQWFLGVPVRFIWFHKLQLIGEDMPLSVRGLGDLLGEDSGRENSRYWALEVVSQIRGTSEPECGGKCTTTDQGVEG
jgi:hypothetical protein